MISPSPYQARLPPDIEKEVMVMEGIQFVVDEKGQKTAVLIDLKKHGELWEDFYDSLITRLRADEPRESLESVKERLHQNEGH